jgi:hypothetical protein
MSDPSLQFNLNNNTGEIRLDVGTLRVYVQPDGGHYTASGWGLIQPESLLEFEALANGQLKFRADSHTLPSETWAVAITCQGDFRPPLVYLDDWGRFDKPTAFHVDRKPVTAAEFIAAVLQINT